MLLRLCKPSSHRGGEDQLSDQASSGSQGKQVIKPEKEHLFAGRQSKFGHIK